MPRLALRAGRAAAPKVGPILESLHVRFREISWIASIRDCTNPLFFEDLTILCCSSKICFR